MILNCIRAVTDSAFSGLKQLGAWGFIARRNYNPQALMDSTTVRHRERAKQLQLMNAKPKTFNPALEHFRLTRFGWEHRKAGRAGERRRKQSTKGRQLSARVGYVNPRDFSTMRIYFPHMLLRQRMAPIDSNINIRLERNSLPAHIG